jgi:hypothetical protein
MPKFSKRHYEAIAKVLFETWPPPTGRPEDRTDKYVQWALVRNHLSTLFAGDNSRFSPSKFEDACYRNGYDEPNHLPVVAKKKKASS